MNPADYFFNVFAQVPNGYIIAGALLVLLMLGYHGASIWLWDLFFFVLLWGSGAPQWLWIVFGIFVVLFSIQPIRKLVLSLPIMKTISALGILPTISDTERIALDAGTTWIDGEYFSGKPDQKAILNEKYPQLSKEEQDFLDNQTEEVCRMTDDWEVNQTKDLPAEVWEYLKKEGFFGMIIRKEFGGLGFSATAMNAIVAKLGSRSIPLSVNVMVPNSLGPAELLTHYGTKEQQDYYLPRLATGDEMPCFALTEPNAGSDASSISSRGTVFKGDDGELYLRLNWEKRYITLAAVSTLLGLAFQLEDPENHLGKGTHPGITCGLIPTDTEGVVLGRRHDPLNTPFINSPTEGHDVVVSVNQIIGGPDQAGNGWKMLMETLAAGRGIFLPAMSTGGAKLSSRITGAYSVVRQQFGISIGKFEGIEELLAPIGGLTYTMEALSRFTCGAVDSGQKPAVLSAVAKYNSSEMNRTIINHAMDLVGGAGIIRGPRNLLAQPYTAIPIAITVEGSNIVTRSLITFGQGLIRCHPYALTLMESLQENNAGKFDRTLWSHIGLVIRNTFRSGLLSLTRGKLASAPTGGPAKKYYKRMAWASSRFALLADAALFSLGGELKKKEQLSGRFADALSWMYLGHCVLRRFEAEGRKKEDLPFVQWSMEHAFYQIQTAFDGILKNFPVPVLGSWLAGPAALWNRLNPIGNKPSDKVTHKVASVLQTTGEHRDRFTEGIYAPKDEEHSQLAILEKAFELATKSEPVYKRIREAVKKGKLQKAGTEQLRQQALEQGVINQDEATLLEETEKYRDKTVEVDAFDLNEMPVNIKFQKEKASKTE